jgi:hypothetical protein
MLTGLFSWHSQSSSRIDDFTPIFSRHALPRGLTGKNHWNVFIVQVIRQLAGHSPVCQTIADVVMSGDVIHPADATATVSAMMAPAPGADFPQQLALPKLGGELLGIESGVESVSHQRQTPQRFRSACLCRSGFAQQRLSRPLAASANLRPDHRHNHWRRSDFDVRGGVHEASSWL